MKYIAIIILALLGIVELACRCVVVVLTAFMALAADQGFLSPWCFDMAEAVLRS